MLTWLLTIVSILPSSFSPSLRLGDFCFGFISGEPSCLSQNWWLDLGSNYVTNNVFSMSFSCQVPNHLQQYFFPFKQTSYLHNYSINTDYLTLNDGLKSWSLLISFSVSCPLGVCLMFSNTAELEPH